MEYPIIYEDIIQGSPEWHALRLKVPVTATKFATIMSKGPGRGKLQDDLVEEWLSKKRKESVQTKYMLDGIEAEPEIRAEYERRNSFDGYKCEVRQVGFIQRSEYVGASPDGLVGPNGIEMKRVILSTQRKYIEGKKLPSPYSPQVYGNIWCRGPQCKWWDFVSWCPECVKIPYWSIRIPRDEKRIAEVDVKVTKFVDELKARIDALRCPF